jgi:hypothetical protein
MEAISMPRKRKAAKKDDPTITVKAAPPPTIEPLATTKSIRCIWDSRLIVGADKTPSGTRYDFNTDETQPVFEMDYQFLLDMRAKAPGCCGGAGGSKTNFQKYFEAVEV